MAKFIKKIKAQLPGCVKKILFRGDGEFFSWESVSACIEEGFDFIIANKGARPPFDPKTWYRPKKRKPYEYNSCTYTPIGWEGSLPIRSHANPKRTVWGSGLPLTLNNFRLESTADLTLL